MKVRYTLFSYPVLVLCVACLASCSPTVQPGGASSALDPREKAAAEATALIQNAEATAVVMKAQAMATALVQNASTAGPTSVLATQTPTPGVTPVVPSEPLTAQATSAASPSPPATGQAAVVLSAEESRVQLLGVSLAPETGLIVVQFKASPYVANRWQQGQVYVVDEETDTRYSVIPVAPLIGPLFSRPKYEGQIGYVMFTNTPPPGLHAGSRVTVVLGDFRQEHVTVTAS